MNDFFRSLYCDKRGAGALEYGLLVGVTSMATTDSMASSGFKLGNPLPTRGTALQ